MKAALLLVLLSAAPLFAQYGPPARDLQEAQFLMRELERQLAPAMNEARDQAAVFFLIARVHNKLTGKQPASEVSDALAMLRDFVDRRERAGKELSRENQRTIDAVRKELELAQPPYAIVALRERLHHEFVHPAEREALKNLRMLENLESSWVLMQQRLMQPIQKEAMNGIVATAKEQSVDGESD